MFDFNDDTWTFKTKAVGRRNNVLPRSAPLGEIRVLYPIARKSSATNSCISCDLVLDELEALVLNVLQKFATPLSSSGVVVLAG
jgi:hypothetical protein